MKYIDSTANKGFIALISVILISSALLAAVLQNSVNVASLFDEARHKQDRFKALQAALKCFDRTILEITHDYFYEVGSSSSISFPDAHCSIISVVPAVNFDPGSGYETMEMSGNSEGITALIDVQIFLSQEGIVLLSEKTRI